jgi:hypothetical protein
MAEPGANTGAGAGAGADDGAGVDGDALGELCSGAGAGEGSVVVADMVQVEVEGM